MVLPTALPAGAARSCQMDTNKSRLPAGLINANGTGSPPPCFFSIFYCMKNTILFIFLYLLTGTAFAQNKQSGTEFLKKYNLKSDSLLLVYLINPGECSKVRAPLKMIQEKVNGMPVKKIFLFKGMRQKEVPYYMTKELKENVSAYDAAISDDYFFHYFRPDESSGLIGIQNQETVFNYGIFDAANKIKVKEAPSYNLNFIDSVHLNETRSPYSKNIQTVSLEPDSIYLLDARYSLLRKVELKTGNEIKYLDFSKYYKEVYSAFFNGNKRKMSFAVNHRSEFSKLNMSECNTANICIKNREIYVIVDFLVLEFDSLFEYGKDTNEVVTYYPFLFRLDGQLNVKSIDPIHLDFTSYSIANSSFQVQGPGDIFLEYKMKNKTFTKPYLIEHKTDPEMFIGEFRKDKGSRYSFTNKLTKGMPDYFLVNKKTYSYSIGNFIDFGDSLGYYFNLTPTIYLLNSGRALQINDTSYKSSFNYKNPFDHFDLKYVYAGSNKNICCLYTKADHLYYCILDKVSGNSIFEQELPKNLRDMPVTNAGENLYFTTVGDTYTTVYKYSPGNK
jgi:hypothetical protein